MTGQTDQIDDMNQHGIAVTVDRHFGDIAPAYSAVCSDAPLNGVHAKARGAADRMWRKVEEDLDKLDMADRDVAGDD